MPLDDEVVVFVTPTCPHCRAAREFLVQRGIAFTEYDVTRDEAALRRLVWLTGRAAVPTIHTRGAVLMGFDSERLTEVLEGVTPSGPLEELGEDQR